jgi:hypothetical protein
MEELTLRTPARPAGQGSPEGDESGGGGPQYLQGNGDGWRRFRPIGADSFEGEEEEEPAELEGMAAEPGEAWNGKGERRLWG